MTVLLVALCGGVGAAVRYTVGSRLDGLVPSGTLLVNAVGSFLLGLFVGWSIDGSALALLGTGFCGGLTTYSSFAVQARDLGPRLGAAYAAATVLLGLGACTVGYLLAQA